MAPSHYRSHAGFVQHKDTTSQLVSRPGSLGSDADSTTDNVTDAPDMPDGEGENYALFHDAVGDLGVTQGLGPLNSPARPNLTLASHGNLLNTRGSPYHGRSVSEPALPGIIRESRGVGLIPDRDALHPGSLLTTRQTPPGDLLGAQVAGLHGGGKSSPGLFMGGTTQRQVFEMTRWKGKDRQTGDETGSASGQSELGSRSSGVQQGPGLPGLELLGRREHRAEADGAIRTSRFFVNTLAESADEGEGGATPQEEDPRAGSRTGASIKGEEGKKGWKGVLRGWKHWGRSASRPVYGCSSRPGHRRKDGLLDSEDGTRKGDGGAGVPSGSSSATPYPAWATDTDRHWSQELEPSRMKKRVGAGMSSWHQAKARSAAAQASSDSESDGGTYGGYYPRPYPSTLGPSGFYSLSGGLGLYSHHHRNNSNHLGLDGATQSASLATGSQLPAPSPAMAASRVASYPLHPALQASPHDHTSPHGQSWAPQPGPYGLQGMPQSGLQGTWSLPGMPAAVVAPRAAASSLGAESPTHPTSPFLLQFSSGSSQAVAATFAGAIRNVNHGNHNAAAANTRANQGIASSAANASTMPASGGASTLPGGPSSLPRVHRHLASPRHADSAGSFSSASSPVAVVGGGINAGMAFAMRFDPDDNSVIAFSPHAGNLAPSQAASSMLFPAAGQPSSSTMPSSSSIIPASSSSTVTMTGARRATSPKMHAADMPPATAPSPANLPPLPGRVPPLSVSRTSSLEAAGSRPGSASPVTVPAQGVNVAAGGGLTALAAGAARVGVAPGGGVTGPPTGTATGGGGGKAGGTTGTAVIATAGGGGLKVAATRTAADVGGIEVVPSVGMEAPGFRPGSSLEVPIDREGSSHRSTRVSALTRVRSISAPRSCTRDDVSSPKGAAGTSGRGSTGRHGGTDRSQLAAAANDSDDKTRHTRSDGGLWGDTSSGADGSAHEGRSDLVSSGVQHGEAATRDSMGVTGAAGPGNARTSHGRGDARTGHGPGGAQGGQGVRLSQPQPTSLLRSRSLSVVEPAEAVLTPLPPTVREVNFSADIKVGALLGSGSFGHVYRGTFCGQVAAIKIIHGANEGIPSSVISSFANEVRVLSRIQHPRTVRLQGFCLQPPNICIVMELMERGSLWKELHERKRRFRYGALLSLAHDIASAMAYLHPRILHRDLKTQNVLLDKSGRAKVADFGMAKLMRDSTASMMMMTRSSNFGGGTVAYMAPEVLSGKVVDDKCDVYSFGVMLWEIFTGQKPWEDEGVPLQIAMAVAVQGRRPPMPSVCPSNLRKLITDCWQENPEARPNFVTILRRVEEEMQRHQEHMKNLRVMKDRSGGGGGFELGGGGGMRGRGLEWGWGEWVRGGGSHGATGTTGIRRLPQRRGECEPQPEHQRAEPGWGIRAGSDSDREQEGHAAGFESSGDMIDGC
eukprot:jgi/Mesvir1/22041/Mv18606-RA.1